jgi:alkyl hydroperoxide reductase subunit AhpF
VPSLNDVIRSLQQTSSNVVGCSIGSSLHGGPPATDRFTLRRAQGLFKRLYSAMPILQTRDEEAVRKEFQRIGGPVKLVVFSQELAAADLCRQNEQLVREVAALNDHISVEVLNLAIDRDRAAAYGVDQVPSIVVEGARDYGIRFFGIPSGYEFSNLIDSIILVSTGDAQLTEQTKTSLGSLANDVEIKVFSTPT